LPSRRSIAATNDASAKGMGGGGGGGRGMGNHASFGGGKFVGGGKFGQHNHRFYGHRYGFGYGYNTCWRWTPAGLVNVCVVPY
jgi:hypothetical protein